jgi:hypothetical protein
MAACTAILARHLSVSIPYGANPSAPELDTRQQIIDTAASRLYAPNGEGELASIMFRDGSRRIVRAPDLMSGAHIANIARAAAERACIREIEDGPSGLTAADVLDAIDDELASAVAALTPANCHASIADLPHDLAVARVERVVKRVRRPHRFRSVA